MLVSILNKKDNSKGEKKTHTDLDVLKIKDRWMVFQLLVDVWGQKTRNFRPHAMLQNKQSQHASCNIK